MDETPMSDSIKKRLSMQNEVLKWLKEFSEKLQRRANDATMEIHGLLDQAGVVELDLKNTFNSFRSLSYNRYIDHRISDEDDVAYHIKESPQSSAEAGIPAQNYETDILPRYKEALSLGLTSCKNHLETTKKNQLTSSVFRTGSAHGLLPHIIGSEEYIHDNSCGLTDDYALGTAASDLSWIMEPKGASSDSVEHNYHDLFGPHLFGMQQGSPDKDGTDHLVSAASDFKAMLEAALLHTYKFYDEESLSVHHAVSDKRSTEQTHNDVDPVTPRESHADPVGTSQHFNISDNIVTLSEGNMISLQDPDIHAHGLYSALASGSLFDTSSEDDPVEVDMASKNDVASSSSIDTGEGIRVIEELRHSDPPVAETSQGELSGRDSVALQDVERPESSGEKSREEPSATLAEELCSRSDSDAEAK